MTDPGTPLTAINGGINRLRVKGAARKDSLYDLRNGYVTAADTVKVRPGTFRNVNLAPISGAGLTKGLVAYQGSKHVFSSEVVPVPDGYTLHVLNNPAAFTTYTPPNPGVGFNPIVESLLHFEDGDGATVFTDDGTNPTTWTAAGGAAETTAKAKFGSGSLSCNTADKYISATIHNGDPLDLVTGNPDWTIEFWVYPVGDTTGATHPLLDWSNGGATGFFLFNNGTQLTVQTFGGSGSYAPWGAAGVSNTGNYVHDEWNHVAICRDNYVLKLFVNGVYTTPGGIGGAFDLMPPPGTTSMKFGGGSAGSTPQQHYMDDIRVTKGVCLYGGNFTPAGPLTTTPVMPYVTSNLMHFDDGDASTAFTDAGGVASWTAAGAAQETTSLFKFGTGSGQFLNDADFISAPITAGNAMDMTADQADYSFEMFVYPLDVSSGNTHVWLDTAHTTSSSENDCMWKLISVGSTVTLKNHLTGATNDIVAAGAFTAASTWYHVAITQYGMSLLLFINGILVGSSVAAPGAAQYNQPISTGAKWFMGANGYAGTQSADGYIDEFRVTRGMAVYRANFTPPVAPYTVAGIEPIRLKEIHFAAPFMGFLYVVAEFEPNPATDPTLGNVFHYWLQTSGEWKAKTVYQIGQIISPTVPNGLQFQAARILAPNPAWAPSTLKTVGDKVEPTVPNGYEFTAVSTDGANPITGLTEPTWPTTTGATVEEDSEQSGGDVVAARAAPQPSTNVPSPGTAGKYANPYSGSNLVVGG